VVGLRIVRGRSLTVDDGRPGNDAVVVNEAFVSEFLGAGEPIGQSVTLIGDDNVARRVTVAGVVPTILRDEVLRSSVVYQPYRANPVGGMVLLSRSTKPVDAMAALLRDEVRSLDPDLPLFNIRTLDSVLSEVLWVNRVFGGMFAIFAGMAVLISGVGIYGVVALTTAQRTQEIGVRAALGAPLTHLWWTMMRTKAAQIAMALGIGIIAAFLLLRLMGGLLVGRFGQDPLTLAASGAFLITVAFLAMLPPIWRATSANPVAALRCE
jgi:ABC-type antimicrobial peptide transport system permease subunit